MCEQKKLAIIATEKNSIQDAIEQYFKDKNVKTELLTSIGSSDNYDLIAGIHIRNLNAQNAINIHPSILPAFDTDSPVSDAFMYGAKVTGITIHRSDGKIIIQYPVLIGNLTHFDELQRKITEIEGKIYPLVIEKILNDTVFDFDDLFKSDTANSKCGACGGCGHYRN